MNGLRVGPFLSMKYDGFFLLAWWKGGRKEGRKEGEALAFFVFEFFSFCWFGKRKKVK